MHDINRFYLPVLLLFVLATQNNLQTASRIHFSCTFFKYFSRTCHVYHWTFFSNPKSYFYTHVGHLLKIASAIQYKSWYESRSVVAPMRTRTQFSAILCSKMGTLFGDVEGGRASDITAVSHKNVREKYSYALGEQRSPHSYAHSWM